MSAKQRNVINTFINRKNVVGMLAVTLTLKQKSNGQRLDVINTSQNLKHALNILNRKVYGTKFKHFNKKMNVFPIIECSKEGRYHYHLIWEVPSNTTSLWLGEQIKKTWLKTKFGYNQMDIQQITDDGWTDYITKFQTKEDQVDWVNVHWD